MDGNIDDSGGLPNRPSLVRYKFVFVIAGIALAATLAAYSTVLNLPFAGDDLDHLRIIGDSRSGHIGTLSALFRPFNEQTVPLLRLFYIGATHLSGLDGAITLRLMLVLVHSATAVFCGLIVLRYTGSRIAALVATVTFAAAAGFSGSVISAPACGIFLLGLAFSTVAVYIVTAFSLRGWNGLAWSLAALVMAVLGMNGSAVFAVTLAILVVAVGDDTTGQRWLMASVAGMIGIGLLLIVAWNLSRYTVVPHVGLNANIVRKFAWIGYTAPLRFLCSWFPGLPIAVARLIADENMRLVNFLAGGSVVICFGSMWLLTRDQQKVVLALLSGALTLALLIAVGRARDSYLGIFLTNRYYHFFLLPFAIQIGFIAGSLVARLANTGFQRWTIIACCLLGGLVGFGIYSSAINLWQSVPHSGYAMHQRAISAGKSLVRLIDREAQLVNSPRSIALLDGNIPFAGIHKDSIALRTLWFTEHPGGVKNVIIKANSISDQDVAFQNAILNRWARMQGRDTPPILVSRDQLVRQLPWLIDFRKDGFENAVISGFCSWNSGSRWLQAAGALRVKRGSGDFILVGNVPKQILQTLGRQTIMVRVVLNDVTLGWAGFAGAPEEEFRFHIPDHLRRSIEDSQEVSVTLESEVTWSPKRLKRGLDERELSVSVMAVGFEHASNTPAGSNLETINSSKSGRHLIQTFPNNFGCALDVSDSMRGRNKAGLELGRCEVNAVAQAMMKKRGEFFEVALFRADKIGDRTGREK